MDAMNIHSISIMYTINIMNSEIRLHRLLLNFLKKNDIKKVINMLLYQILTCNTNGKI